VFHADGKLMVLSAAAEALFTESSLRRKTSIGRSGCG